MCFEEEGVRHEVKTRTENWPLDPGRRKLLETLTQNGLGAVMTMMSKDCVWCVVAGTADGVSLSPPLAGTVFVSLSSQHLPLCDREYILLVFKFAACPPPPTQLEQKFHRCTGGFLFYSLVYPRYTNEKPYQGTR